MEIGESRGRAIFSRSRVGIAVVSIGLSLLLLRLFAPILVRNHVNGVLSGLDGFRGSIQDVDLAIFRGAYTVEGLVLEKVGGSSQVPFLKVKTMDLSVEWGALFNGSLVGELVLEEPELVLVASEDERREQLGGEEDWVDSIRSFLPITLNRFEVVNGMVSFGSGDDGPLAGVTAKAVQLLASDISNVERDETELPSEVVATAVLGDDAPMRLEGRFDLIGEEFGMDMNFQSEPIDLPYLNPILRRYANLDVRSGQLGLYAEWAVVSGNVDGYLKFLIRGIDVFELGEDAKNPLSLLWEAVAGFLVTLTENRNKDQFAAKVPFSGSTKNLETGLFPTIGSLLKNAFVKALAGDVEDTINLEDFGTER